MCGIAGLIDFKNVFDANMRQSVLQKMTDAIQHRGPDDGGVWHDDIASLGHRRLSIIDLSPAGHQPMASSDGRWQIVFNGEIYNHHNIKAELPDITWRGYSDTEVLLNAIMTWGVEKTLTKLNGMFAFAAWDQKEQQLYLVRDRFGEKPLYYGWVNGCFAFASELRPFMQIPGFSKNLSTQAITAFFQNKYIPAPYSIFEDVKKLPAGQWLTVSSHLQDAPQPYWSLANCTSTTTSLTEGDVLEQLTGLISDAVKMRLESDVPLGAFLSGGTDSSVVVGMMQQHMSQPAETFTIGFNDKRYDEAPYAKQVAEHLKTNHHEHYVGQKELLNIVPELALIYDEPFADFSQIPTSLLTKVTRESVTVSLSGDGGDELFAGYGRHHKAAAEWSNRKPAKKAAIMPLLTILQHLKPQSRQLKKLAAYRHKNFSAYYNDRFSVWPSAHKLVKGASRTSAHSLPAGLANNPLAAACYLDALEYLPENIETKIDRASMAVGLEARAPLLDHRIWEFVYQLPPESRFLNTPKGLLKNVLRQFIPDNLIDRPKQGFEPPLADWLRGELKDWAFDLIQKQDPYLDQKSILKVWQKHQRGRNQHQELWTVLMFRQWLQQYQLLA